jgi:glycosyltransferase involved in cell wall biosynthesis
MAVIYPAPVYFDGSQYTTDVHPQYQFANFGCHFDGLDLVVFLKHTGKQSGREILSSEGIRVFGLPFCRNGLELYLMKLPLWLAVLIRILWVHRKKWDVVLLHDLLLPNQFAYVFCSLLGLRTVLLLAGRHADGIWQAHCYDPLLKRAMAWIYSKWVASMERYMVRRMPTMADYIPDALSGTQPREGNDKFLLYVGAMIRDQDTDPPRPARADSVIRLLSVGRVVPIKGYEYLIEAVDRLRKGGVPVNLRIIGPLYGDYHGGYEHQLRSMIRELDLEKDVCLIGSLPFGEELMDAYRTADIFVLSSISEGIPKVLCEAMAKGLPVVATSVGGIPWILKETGAGLSVRPRDSEALARAISEAYLSRQQLSEKAFRGVKRFTAEVQMKRVAEFIHQACGF